LPQEIASQRRFITFKKVKLSLAKLFYFSSKYNFSNFKEAKTNEEITKSERSEVKVEDFHKRLSEGNLID